MLGASWHVGYIHHSIVGNLVMNDAAEMIENKAVQLPFLQQSLSVSDQNSSS